jgi:GNAT superfamily N-acetyltransferase
MNQCIVRPATVSDAASAVAVLRESITHLCTTDHQNDPETLQLWLRNKTTDNFCQWLQDIERHFLVAELESEVCGVGMVRVNGDLDLCYIQPGKERLGIGAAMLRALEAQASRWGLSKLQLISTANARGFYEHHGYVFTGEESVPEFGVVRDYYYVKDISSNPV